jgi:hypothetical protein
MIVHLTIKALTCTYSKNYFSHLRRPCPYKYRASPQVQSLSGPEPKFVAKCVSGVIPIRGASGQGKGGGQPRILRGSLNYTIAID